MLYCNYIVLMVSYVAIWAQAQNQVVLLTRRACLTGSQGFCLTGSCPFIRAHCLICSPPGAMCAHASSNVSCPVFVCLFCMCCTNLHIYHLIFACAAQSSMCLHACKHAYMQCYSFCLWDHIWSQICWIYTVFYPKLKSPGHNIPLQTPVDYSACTCATRHRFGCCHPGSTVMFDPPKHHQHFTTSPYFVLW